MTVGRLGRNAGHVSTQIVTRAVTATRTVVTETTRINQRHLVTVLPVAGTVRPRAVRMSIPSSRVAETARVLHLVTTRWTSGVEVGLRVIIRWTSGGVEPRQGTVRWSSEVVGALQLTVGWTSRVSESVWVMLGREITKDAVNRARPGATDKNDSGVSSNRIGQDKSGSGQGDGEDKKLEVKMEDNKQSLLGSKPPPHDVQASGVKMGGGGSFSVM
ncbi:hypothetical protein NP493_615g02012 [Ridgeia piscesae]|uniref:Uncharacterized protein n=1 Tax=Ridgeia piscesae TaxID=27915 RepID=A0AAD9NQT5_RIDPI|nr:hypothetical protein NP493_615g02012 [Ridgeia piscesae]